MDARDAPARGGGLEAPRAEDTGRSGVLAARAAGATAHLGDFFHHVFLHHMALNGIEVYAALT